MKSFIRKLSVLMVIFSGMFIFIGDVVAAVLRIQAGSVGYCFLQGTGATILVLLLSTKKLHVF